MTTKQKAVELISMMPEEATVADIMAELYVQLKIEEGTRDMEAGRTIEHEQLEKRLRKWLA